jgi:hypothetical protein
MVDVSIYGKRYTDTWITARTPVEPPAYGGSDGTRYITNGTETRPVDAIALTGK